MKTTNPKKKSSLPVRSALLLSAPLVLSTAPVSANEFRGTGGSAWVCAEDSAGKRVRWMTPLTAYEAKNEFGLDPIEITSADYGRDVFAAARKLAADRISPADAFFADAVVAEIDRIASRITEVPMLELVPEPYRILPDRALECPGGHVLRAQIATFAEDGRVLVSKSAYGNSKLSFASRVRWAIGAAIEGVLRSRRSDRTDTSDAREIAAYSFSSTQTKALEETIRYYAYHGGNDGMVGVQKGKFDLGGKPFEFYYRVKWGKTWRWFELVAPLKLEGPRYRIELPAGSTFSWNHELRQTSFIPTDCRGCWVELYSQRVPIEPKREIRFHAETGLRTAIVSAGSLRMGGRERTLPAPALFVLDARGTPVSMKVDANPELVLGASGSSIDVRVKNYSEHSNTFQVQSNGPYPIRLDAEGNVTSGVFSNLTVSRDGKTERHRPASLTYRNSADPSTVIRNGSVVIPGKAYQYRIDAEANPAAFCAEKLGERLYAYEYVDASRRRESRKKGRLIDCIETAFLPIVPTAP